MFWVPGRFLAHPTATDPGRERAVPKGVKAATVVIPCLVPDPGNRKPPAIGLPGKGIPGLGRRASVHSGTSVKTALFSFSDAKMREFLLICRRILPIRSNPFYF
jgi:hypothetical protein